jgi:hypothetical protein
MYLGLASSDNLIRIGFSSKGGNFDHYTDPLFKNNTELGIL